MRKSTKNITDLVLRAAQKARKETSADPEPFLTTPVKWPAKCIVGPGLEGAIACESKIGYVNGTNGQLVYRGYDIFDLCAYSTYEEVSYLLLHGSLPTASQLKMFSRELVVCRSVPDTLRLLLNFPIEKMNPMAALRLGVNLMRQEFTFADQDDHKISEMNIIGTDEDSIPMETPPRGEESAIYEFKGKEAVSNQRLPKDSLRSAVGYKSCYHLIAGVGSITAAISRIRQGHFPIEPQPTLSHAANLIYMMSGRRPSPEEERIMDIMLILHADHGMNASTFAAMVVASTLSDIYFSVGSGIAALSGPLHGGANERVLHMLKEIGSVKNVRSWYRESRRKKRKIMGFGHRVYKSYDPRGRILSPLIKYLVKNDKESLTLFRISQCLEKEVVSTLGAQKKIFPNVDYYSGIAYHALGISSEFFTSMFAVSRVAGWTARVEEYLENNRIFRPRAMYVGPLNKRYTPIKRRTQTVKSELQSKHIGI